MGSNNRDYRAQEAQLIMSLKFHHAKTLSEIPLDVAVNALTKVWRSCQPHLQNSGDEDVIHL
ncbi:hypothetical protein [Lyngbya confervoides]|uniref:Transposase n=1 Tax=Lyngbya confervoides BDU141951 TaxID=1574623 RepID=A0ABD4T2H0_9CYAN|nr:hypothetical protein [Lyngbya confervoides]MCM1982790.1 hypothetical protein [Lyngbya confervoides BDU141951]